MIRQLKYTKQLFLPDSRFVTIDFLSGVFSGRKLLLPMDEVRFVNLPMLKSFSVRNLLKKVVKRSHHIMKYLPDFELDELEGSLDGEGHSNKKCTVPRDYMIAVLNALKPGFFMKNFEKIMEESREEKLKKEQEKQKQILITEEFYDLLHGVPLLPFKRKFFPALISFAL